jgi:pimeloyl-ACP methyl ester carboxylesterase
MIVRTVDKERRLAQSAHIRTSVLDVAYEHGGPAAGLPVVLLHGYPYDPRAFDEVVPILNAAGLRTIVPYLRGYGGTRFLSRDAARSGEQAAIGQDVLDLLDALGIGEAVLAGFDWGARAACVVAALWPERVRALVSCAGYQIQDIANSGRPADPEQERRFWYQYYFQTERGCSGLAQMRVELGRLLWKLWSPTWMFDEATYRRPLHPSPMMILSMWSSIPIATGCAMRRVMRATPRSNRAWQACPGSAFPPLSFTAPWMT